MDLEEIFNFGETDEKYRVLPWHKRVWYGQIKPSLALPVPCKIYLRDWRLGLMRTSCQLCIFVYVFVSVLSAHSYLLLEPVQVLTQFKVFHPDMAALHQAEYADAMNGTQVFCSVTPLYNFVFSPGNAQRPADPIRVSGCKAVQAAEAYKREGARSLMLHTVITETHINRLSVAVDPTTGDVTNCADELAAAGMMCEADQFGTEGVVRYAPYSPITQMLVNTDILHPDNDPLPPRANNGTCECTHKNHFFALGVEDLTVQIEHLWQTTFAHGSFPETRVKKDGGEGYKAIFPAGSPPMATLRTWLEWMEIDLDGPINLGNNTQWMLPTDAYKAALLGPTGLDRFDFPRPRLTGVRVKVTMDYFNHYSVPGSSKIGLFTSPQPKPVCILTLTPLPIWTESIGLFNTAQDYPYTYLEQQNLQHTDIRMTIETRGMVGKFTFSQLTATLVSALVLLGSVDVFLILTARLAFGEKSRFYDDMLYEKVSLVFNFARFATRSLVGSMVFDAVDEDRGGKMNKEELFEVLHKVLFLQNVSPKHTGSLVEFVYDVIEKNMESEDEVDEAERANRAKTGEDQGEIDMEIARVEGVKPVVAKEIRIDGKMHKVREDAKVIIDDEETLNLEDWINIFHGPPCNVDSMVELVQDSNKRGKFLPPKEETPEGITYANANQTVLTTMEKERRNPRSRANLKREEEVANKLMNTVMFVGRELESMQGDMRAHREEVKQSVSAARRLKASAAKKDS